jgi:2'-5' RNA ligase
MTPTETAVIVAVPEVEPVVAAYRERLDHAASWGVPAHVTVLYPFLPPDRIDAATLHALREAVAGVPAFDVTFDAVGWFGQDVVWLAPEPAEPFRALTRAVWARFPDHPPYRGEYADLQPHLTVGHGKPLADLREAEHAVAQHLPLAASVSVARLIQGTAEVGSWHTRAELPLGRISPR